MFAYAASHSLLLALFAGYAAHSGALNLGTLISGLLVRQFCRRRHSLLDRAALWRPLARNVFSGSSAPSRPSVRLTDRYYVWMILFHRFPNGVRGPRGVRLRNIATALVRFPRAQLCRGGPLVRHRRLGRLCLRSILGEVDKRRLFRPGYRDVGRVPRPVLVAEQEARSGRGAVLKQAVCVRWAKARCAVPTISPDTVGIRCVPLKHEP